MKAWLTNVSSYFVAAVASFAAVRWIGSNAISDLLLPNLATFVVALLAINVQTTAVIAVKLRELTDKVGANFDATIQQFRLAFYEQASLVLFSFALSAMSKAKNSDIDPMWVDIGAVFTLYASLHIFLDTTFGLLDALFPRTDNDEAN
jgi:hypothetical protein